MRFRRRGPDVVEPPAQTRLDRLITAVSPEWGAKRAAARAHLGIILRHYDGAALGRRTEGWRTPSTDANEAARWNLQRLRDRCRDLSRNNCWAGRGVRVMTRSVIGTGIMMRLADPEGRPLEDATSKELRLAWARWALTPEIDADGRLGMYGMQRLLMRTIQQSGEVLVRRRWRRLSDGLTVPLQLQVLEPDYLDKTKDGDARADGTGEPVRRINGVEFDMLNRRRGYWLYRDHPGSSMQRDVRSVFVPASEIQHLYRVDRPGQVVGIPPLAPVVIHARDLYEFQDAWLMRNKIAAMFAGFIHDSSDIDALGSPTAKVNPDGTVGDTFEPGTIERLPPGKQITFNDPPDLSGYPDYVSAELRAIAMALDVTYEQLTGDLRGTNFTSGRMGSLTHWEAVDDWRWDVMVPGFCDQVMAWFALAWEMRGGKLPGDMVPRWTPPRRAMLAPTEETAASIKAVRGGLQSYSESLREQGYERDEVLDELSDDIKAMHKRGLMLEVDTGADATRQAKNTTGEKNNGGRPTNGPPK